MARAPRPTTKAGRNEGRKLLAALLNNVGAALILAGLLQPTLGMLRQHESFSLSNASLSLALVIVALILVVASQSIARRLED